LQEEGEYLQNSGKGRNNFREQRRWELGGTSTKLVESDAGRKKKPGGKEEERMSAGASTLKKGIKTSQKKVAGQYEKGFEKKRS